MPSPPSTQALATKSHHAVDKAVETLNPFMRNFSHHWVMGSLVAMCMLISLTVMTVKYAECRWEDPVVEYRWEEKYGNQLAQKIFVEVTASTPKEKGSSPVYRQVDMCTAMVLRDPKDVATYVDLPLCLIAPPDRTANFPEAFRWCHVDDLKESGADALFKKHNFYTKYHPTFSERDDSKCTSPGPCEQGGQWESMRTPEARQCPAGMIAKWGGEPWGESPGPGAQVPPRSEDCTPTDTGTIPRSRWIVDACIKEDGTRGAQGIDETLLNEPSLTKIWAMCCSDVPGGREIHAARQDNVAPSNILSQFGPPPWDFWDAKAVCEADGKRLCRKGELDPGVNYDGNCIRL